MDGDTTHGQNARQPGAPVKLSELTTHCVVNVDGYDTRYVYHDVDGWYFLCSVEGHRQRFEIEADGETLKGVTW